MTTGRLSDDERAGLDRDGYVVRHCVFAPTEIAEIVSECEALVADLVRDRHARRFPVGSYVFDPDFLRAGVIKVFADGVMEYPAQTAALPLGPSIRRRDGLIRSGPASKSGRFAKSTSFNMPALRSLRRSENDRTMIR